MNGQQKLPVLKKTGPVQETQAVATVVAGPVSLPEEKNYKIYDIAGQQVQPLCLSPDIYFIELENEIHYKIVKIR